MCSSNIIKTRIKTYPYGTGLTDIESSDICEALDQGKSARITKATLFVYHDPVPQSHYFRYSYTSLKVQYNLKAPEN